MSAQLGEDCAQVEVCVCERVLLLAGPFQRQGVLQAGERCPQFARFAVIASLVVESDGHVLGRADGIGICLL
ncbi:unnamed protein product [Sphagnum balticum]